MNVCICGNPWGQCLECAQRRVRELESALADVRHTRMPVYPPERCEACCGLKLQWSRMDGIVDGPCHCEVATQAREEGRRAGLEEAAREASDIAECIQGDDKSSEGWRFAGRTIAAELRALAAKEET